MVSHISREHSESLPVSKQQSSFSGRFEFSVLRQKKKGISGGDFLGDFWLPTPKVGWVIKTSLVCPSLWWGIQQKLEDSHCV